MVRCRVLLNKAKLFFVFLSLLLPFSAPAELFSNPRLGGNGRVSFEVVTAGLTGARTLVCADVAGGEFDLLTCYPERMELLSGGSVLQIRNQFGTARYSSVSGDLIWVSRTNSFAGRKSGPEAVSFDGRWVCFVRRKNAVRGELVLRSASTSEEKVLAADVPFSFSSVPVKWSPDSRIFVYEAGGRLFFCDPDAEMKNLQPDESFREIGGGGINSIEWSSSPFGRSSLVYIDGDIVYRISANEIHTRGLYRKLVGIGSVSARLPFSFDPGSDLFWADGESVAVLKSGNVLSVFGRGVDFSAALSPPSLPVSDCAVFWFGGKPLVWFCDARSSSVMLLSEGSLVTLSRSSSRVRPSLSPDGSLIALATDDALEVRDGSFSVAAKFSGEKIVSCVWGGNSSIFVGSEKCVSLWDFSRGKNVRKTLFLSSVASSAWVSGRNVARACDGTLFEYVPASSLWREIDSSSGFARLVDGSISSRQVQDGKYRVYVGKSASGRDGVFVRTLSGDIETRDIVSGAGGGSYKGRVELVFDALDSDEGLDFVLSVLDFYNIKATFFINGEFIRRFPEKVRMIAGRNHVCASMFFSGANLLELARDGYVVDGDFIARGLARNEDEFLAATGKELSLLWHAPFYKATQAMKDAGARAGYEYFEAGRFSLDAADYADGNGGRWHMKSSEIVLFYVENSFPGCRIPVTIGKSSSGRADYLYQKLDLLVDALISEGFSF